MEKAVTTARERVRAFTVNSATYKSIFADQAEA